MAAVIVDLQVIAFGSAMLNLQLNVECVFL